MSGAAQIERIQELLQRLRLMKALVELPQLLQEAGKKEVSYSDFLEELLSRETTAKKENCPWYKPPAKT